jgi:hypothetical protein
LLINSRLQRLLKEIGIEEQNGFSSGRGCADGSFFIRQALKKRREHGQESWVLFVDLAKAFDSVPRDVLWEVLAKMGVGSSSSPHSRHQAYERGPEGDLRSERRACGSTMNRWREARVSFEPDALPFRHASLLGVPGEGHASGC